MARNERYPAPDSSAMPPVPANPADMVPSRRARRPIVPDTDLPPGSLYPCSERTFEIAAADSNQLLDVDRLTKSQETKLGLQAGSLRPILASMRFAFRTGDADSGAYVTVPIKVWLMNPSHSQESVAGGPQLAPVDAVLLADYSTLSTFFDEGPNRSGYGIPLTSDGWMDIRLFVDGSTVAGLTGEVAFNLAWELRP